MRRTNITIILICLILACSCKDKSSFSYSTYWWKNNTELNESQKMFLSKNKIKKIYLKIFDLKFDRKNIKILTPGVKSGFNEKNLCIIPVIYIENSILKNFKTDTIFNILKNKIKYSLELGIIKNINFLQIDCDWTLKTKKTYFELLTLLSNEIDELSVTIRLHQIKYYNLTGVPPVKKGVMMIYNLDSPVDTNIENSIFTFNNAIRYLKKIKEYPIRLDVGLPAFSWGVHYHHGKIKNLISDFDPKKIDSENMYQKKNGYFKSKKAHFYKTYRISKRDEIRYEYPKITEVKEILNFLSRNLNQDSTEIIFFSLNSNFLINNANKYENIISTHN
ncbi:hypothetical protein OAR04_01800 [Flavobacteriales bacterium]|nr:hypothetical protein [Flavobacteriales bacterium]